MGEIGGHCARFNGRLAVIIEQAVNRRRGQGGELNSELRLRLRLRRERRVNPQRIRRNRLLRQDMVEVSGSLLSGAETCVACGGFVSHS